MGDAMPSWGPLLRTYLHNDEEALPGDADEKAIDMHFFKVLYRQDADPKPFARMFVQAMKTGGEFAPMTPARMKEGPSYIEIGAFLGDQHTALMVMALGYHLGYFELLTPKGMGIEDKETADAMAGSGYVLARLTEEGAERMRADSTAPTTEEN